ncbi:hypothetical protein S40293_11156 [Stachybotrys chartarum IBT 40293]|nr:hypothetical protein S40293_11156 [Stachybotrys chartarum IBT 40293]
MASKSITVNTWISHADVPVSCLFASCGFQTTSHDVWNRKQFMRRHINREHAVVASSFDNLRDLDLREVEGKRNMTWSASTFIDVCADGYVLTTLATPAAIVDDCRPAGAYRSSSPNSADIYEQLPGQAIFVQEDELYDRNIFALLQPATRNNSIGLYRSTMILPLAYETRNGVRELICLMFLSGRWREPTAQQAACNVSDPVKDSTTGTHLCKDHALRVLGSSNPQTAPQRLVGCACRALKSTNISEDEVGFLDRFRHRQSVFATDTETVGPLLVQVAVINTNRDIVFQVHIHHDCATVDELWRPATKACAGKLTNRQRAARCEAFGLQSAKVPKDQGLACGSVEGT